MWGGDIYSLKRHIPSIIESKKPSQPTHMDKDLKGAVLCCCYRLPLLEGGDRVVVVVVKGVGLD